MTQVKIRETDICTQKQNFAVEQIKFLIHYLEGLGGYFFTHGVHVGGRIIILSRLYLRNNKVWTLGRNIVWGVGVQRQGVTWFDLLPCCSDLHLSGLVWAIILSETINCRKLILIRTLVGRGWGGGIAVQHHGVTLI